MRLNGVNPETLHKCISVSAEVLPSAPERQLVTVESGRGEILTAANTKQGEYTVRINIAAATYEEAMQARLLLAQWACSTQLMEAEPSHLPGKAYSVILKSISPIEKRFGTVDVVFAVPMPYLHSVQEKKATATGKELAVFVGGTAKTEPVITAKPANDVSNLMLHVNGAPLVKLRGTVHAGQVVAIDLQNGGVTVDGAHAENRIVYTDTDLDKEFPPKRNTVTCNAEAELTVRWREQWL